MKAIAWIRLFTPQPICRIWWTRSQMNKGNWLGATHVRQTYKVFDLFETLWWRTDTFLHHFFVKEPQNLCSHWHQWFLDWVLNGKSDYWIAHILKAQWGTIRVWHGYGNTRGDPVTGTTGTGTVLVFGTTRHTVYPYHGITGISRV